VQKTMCRKIKSSLKLWCFALVLLRKRITETKAFSTCDGSLRKCCRRRKPCFISTTALYVMPDPFVSIDTLASISAAVETNDAMQAEVLNDMSHIVSDLAGLAPTTYLLRLLTIVARLLGVTSDYVYDHKVLPDELFFQSSTLAVSSVLFFKSMFPMVKSLFISTDPLDKAVYDQLFSPVGVSWMQFKALKVSALDWIEVLPGTVLVDEHELVDEQETNQSRIQPSISTKANNNIGDNILENLDTPPPPSIPLYWLYKGDVVFSFRGTEINYVERSDGKSINDPCATGLLADMRFLYKMDDHRRLALKQQPLLKLKHLLRLGKTSPQSSEVDSALPEEPSTATAYPMASVAAGDKGAVLLRINSEKLLELIEHDDQLRDSMRSILLKGLQRKVGNLLRMSALKSEENGDRDLDSTFHLDNED